MKALEKEKAVASGLEKSVIRALLYFDLFQYPITLDEVCRFMDAPVSTQLDVAIVLDDLEQKGLVHRYLHFYSLEKSRKLVARRMKGNRKAAEMTALAHRRGKLLGNFPFVRGVMASGSFSKGYMDENSDLDFFVITKTGRLWIARMLIVLFKRIVYRNSHKYFCCNYFIDEAHLTIEEKNLFTATELATLLPLYGARQYELLISQNGWISEFLPNFRSCTPSCVDSSREGILKKIVEKILRGRLADFVDSLCMKLTLRRWKRLYTRMFSSSDFDLAFKTRTYVSKNHPRHFQRNVLSRYEEKVREFERSTNEEESR